MLRKIYGFISIFILTFIVTVFILTMGKPLPPASAEENVGENWDTLLWDGDVQELERLSAARGILSKDVFWVNDGFPSKGETLLVPKSKTGVLLTWMEVQNRKNAVTLTTVKLHGVPLSLRGTLTEPRTAKTAPSAENRAVIASKDAGSVVPRGTMDPSKKPAAAGHAVQSPVQLPVTPPPVSPLPPLPSLSPLPSLPPLPPLPSSKPAVVPPSSSKMIWPVSGKISSGFGRRGKRRFHAGIDIPMPQGTPIAVAKDGVVLEVATNKSKRYRGYGNAALVDHGNGITTLYAHCQRVNVKAGQKIKQGDIVGWVGNTGRTTTYHVHFEVRKNGKPVNPIPYLMPR